MRMDHLQRKKPSIGCVLPPSLWKDRTGTAVKVLVGWEDG